MLLQFGPTGHVMWKTLLVWEMAVASAHGLDSCALLHGLMPHFNLDNYMGVWYPLLGWSNSAEGHARTHCSKDTFSHENGNITVKEESFSDRSGFHNASHNAWQDNANESKITMWMFQAIKVPIWVVDTDYKHWAVAYSCLDNDGDYIKTLQVLGRGRDFAKLWSDPEAKKSIRKSLRRSSLLRLRDLATIDQHNCHN